MPVDIRAAVSGDIASLADIARRAKRHWGYSDEWMELWNRDLTVIQEYIHTHKVLVAVIGDRPIGFCALETNGQTGTIEHCWITPEHQRAGAGRALIERTLGDAASAGLTKILVTSDPSAEAFYLILGARRIGSVAAPMPGAADRTLPTLEFGLS